jgi:hypothetical protein
MVAHHRRRWIWIVAGGVVLAGVGAFVLVRFVFLHDTTTALSPGDALARYRASSTVATSPATSAASARSLPAPGVYRYATTGSEHVDALGGTTHSYPASTTVTVTPAGCGIQTRWDALQERWNSRQLCLDDSGIVTGTYTDFHRFYGQDDRGDWTCTPPYVLVPAASTPGASWTGTCADGKGTTESTSLSVVAMEDVVAAGQHVATVHMRRVEDDVGKDTTAHTSTDQWFDVRTGLVVREAATSSSTTSTFMGDVHYTEQYELTITSLDPQR